MNTQQSGNNRLAGITNQRRVPILSILVTLDAFVLGGLVALFMVNRFLDNHLARYAQGDFTAAGSTILDLMDDLLIYFVVYIGVLLLLLLSTAVIWVWSKTQSPMLRYGVVLLVVSIALIMGIVWVGRMTTTTPPPPTTPTPIALIDVLIHSTLQNWRPA